MDSCMINTFLNFVDPYIIEVFVFVLYFIFKEKDLKYVILLIAFTRLFNALIKSFLQIPLPEMSLRGTAFPGGHLQIAAVFYGWLVYRYKNPFLILLALFMLYAGAYTQVQCGFHYVSDVVAGAVISFVLVFTFFKMTNNLSEKTKVSIILITSTLVALVLFKYSLPCYRKNGYLFMTLYKILGFGGSYILYYGDNLKKITFKLACISAITAFVLKFSNFYILNQSYWCFILGMLPILNRSLRFLKELTINMAKGNGKRKITFSMILART